MSGPDLFFDNSALFAGIASASGASRALLLLAEVGQVSITISEQVVAETERAIARKSPVRCPTIERRCVPPVCALLEIPHRRK